MARAGGHGLSTRSRRLALIAGYADAYERKPPSPPPERHIEAQEPGELIGVDCFYVGRLAGTKDRILPFENTAARLQTLNSSIRVVPVENGPHNIGWTFPDECNSALLDFLG